MHRMLTPGLLQLDTIIRQGFLCIPEALSRTQLDELLKIADSILGENRAPGVRSPLQHSPELAGFVRTLHLEKSMGKLIAFRSDSKNSPHFLTRSILFDKSPEANWDVTWHQDTTICVRERIETPGFGPWSIKDGRPHVRPPAAVLERMVTLRIHLDDCDRNNGALHVIPFSHRLGILNETQIVECVQKSAPEICEVPAGGIMIMRPLLLHASKKSTKPDRRRVLHLEFAIDDLPNGLSWNRELPEVTAT